MRILFLIFILLFSANILYSQSDFNRGYKVGYEEGYCYQKGIGCIAPMAPMAPLPNAKESFNSYRDGYNRGFLDGNNGSKQSPNTSPYGRKSYTREPEMFTPNYQFLENILRTRSGNNISEINDTEKAILEINNYYTKEHYERVNNLNNAYEEAYESYPKKLSKIPDGMYAIILASKMESGETRDFYGSALARIKNNEVIYISYFDPFFGQFKEMGAISYVPLQGLQWETRITSSQIQGGKGEIFSDNFVFGKKFEVTSGTKFKFWLFASTMIYNLD